MASKQARRRKRTRTIETLEVRQVMSADPLLGGAIEQHSFQDSPEAPPSLVQHLHTPDFSIDSSSERDLDTMLGDIQQTLSSAHDSTGLKQVRNDYGFIGTGQTVAIIDSGIAWDHAALGGGFGSSYRVVGGWDFTEENDASPYDDGASGSHGTHVAGIVGGDRSGTDDDGVAPGVDLVGLRVFNDAGDGYFSWVENALRWVHTNRNNFENPITAVNLSLGAAWNSTSLPSWAVLEDEFAQLKADGIFTAVSAGNGFANYDVPGLAYPAASPHVVPVMAVRDNGTFANFSQRHTSAIAAPGQYIVSTVPDYAGNHNGITDDYASFSGTSMASPYVAGASVLVREAMQFVGQTNVTQDTIYSHMMATATTFLDSVTGLNYNRLNVANALNALMPTDEYGSTIETAHNLGTLTGTSEISGLIGKLSDSDYFTFTASANGTVTFTADTTHGLVPVWNGTSGTVGGENGETFTFSVVAGQAYAVGLSTSDGIGYYDLDLELTADAPPVPTMPGAVQATAISPTQVSLTWTDSSHETTYQIARWSAETGTVVAANLAADATSHTISGLPPGSRQWFKITARNAVGAVTTDWQMLTMPYVAPTAPTGFTAGAASPTSVTLNWTDCACETGYQITRWSSSTGTLVVANIGANATSYTVNNLPANSRQLFAVTARNPAGSASTAWQAVVLPESIPPTVPGSFQVTATSSSQASLSWSDSTGEDYYQVVHWSSATGSRVLATVAANTTNFTADGLAPGTRHFFRVQAGNSAGGATTAWQLIETPVSTSAASIADNSLGNDDFNSSMAAMSLRQDGTESFAGRVQHTHFSASWLQGSEASYAMGMASLDTADDDTYQEAFGELQSQDIAAALSGDSADDHLLDDLAESQSIAAQNLGASVGALGAPLARLVSDASQAMTAQSGCR